MGYAVAMSPCIVCKEPFCYNPHKVPSTSAITGTREPVCRFCMEMINEKRVKNGMPPFQIQPDAYDPIPEEEL
jgi:hypothetical protein